MTKTSKQWGVKALEAAPDMQPILCESLTAATILCGTLNHAHGGHRYDVVLVQS